MMGLYVLTSCNNLKAVMSMPRINVRIVLPNFIAAAVVLPMLIIMETVYMMHMISDVNCRENGLNVLL